MINQTIIDNIPIEKGINIISSISQKLTDFIVSSLSSSGFIVSTRWVSVLMIFVSLLLIFIAMKITQPFMKWALIIIGGLLIISLAIPW